MTVSQENLSHVTTDYLESKQHNFIKEKGSRFGVWVVEGHTE